jgi:hypothetical protein
MSGWHPVAEVSILRELSDSEFTSEFDSLPPAIASYLLAMPDALVYQFITALRPGPRAHEIDHQSRRELPVAPVESYAGFVTELYLGKAGRFDEKSKISRMGRIGCHDQFLRFDIASSTDAYSAIRLDPADRPGFFHLRQIRVISSDSELVWNWSAQSDSVAALSHSAHQQIVFHTPWPLIGDALLLLYGDDPWVQLPLSPEQLAANQSHWCLP